MTITVWSCQFLPDDDQAPDVCEWNAHWYEEKPIKVTAKRVYVSAARYDRDEIALDRAALERDGKVTWSGRDYRTWRNATEDFYLSPGEGVHHSLADKYAAEVAGYCFRCDKDWCTINATTVPAEVWERCVAAEFRDRDICQRCWDEINHETGEKLTHPFDRVLDEYLTKP